MTILTIPDYGHIVRSRFGLMSHALVFQGALKGGGQTVEIPADLWSAEATLMTLWGDDAAAWRVFLLNLRGPGGRFYFGDPNYPGPRGAPTGAPVVDGAGQTGSTLAIRGATASVSGWLKAGDYFAVDVPTGHRELKVMTADAATDGSGDATLGFSPPLRESPADGTAIITAQPGTVMQLVDDDQSIWDGDGQWRSGFAFKAVEAADIP